MLALSLAALLAAGPAAPEKPKDVGLRESERVNLVAVEVTVWPKDLGSDACVGLTSDDFELTVNGKPRPIYAVDALGVEEEAYQPEAGARADDISGEAANPGGMSFVLLFDLWHLDVFFRGFPGCPRTKPLAFAEARRFVETEFHDGDRLLIVTFAGWPVIHHGWIRKRADAMAALDRVERSPRVLNPNQAHSHHEAWIAGMESLFLALGRYPGRKDVIYLADDFRFDDVSMRMYEIAGRAQANGVVVNSMDMVWICRHLVGRVKDDLPLGLGETPFRVPVALVPFTADTGGRLFRTDRIDTAARELRALRKCRYLVSFRKDPSEGKRAPSIDLKIRGERAHGLTLLRPSSYEPAAKAPTPTQRNEALFLIPRFGRGLAADATLWPYRPVGKKGNRWKTFVLARLDRTGDEPWPDDLSEIKVTVLLHRQSTIYGEYTKSLTGEALAAFREKGTSGLMLFPADEVVAGETTVDLIATTNVGDVSARASASFEVPKAPAAGEARPWFLADHLARIAGNAVLAPSLDGVVMPGELVAFLGYACAAKEGAKEIYTGSLVPLAGGTPLEVRVSWLERGGACGWLAGKVDTALQPGLWTFKPPPELSGGGAAVDVDFNVAGTEAMGAGGTGEDRGE